MFGITIRYVAAIPNEDKPGLAGVNEIVPLLPNVASPLRLFGPQSSLALAGLDAFAAIVQAIASTVILDDDLDAL
jgi:hypothetical protein